MKISAFSGRIMDSESIKYPLPGNEFPGYYVNTPHEVVPGGECTPVTAFGNLSSGTTKYQFVNWTEKDSSVSFSTDNPLKLSPVNKSMAITANFKAVDSTCYTVNFKVSDGGGGTIVYADVPGGRYRRTSLLSKCVAVLLRLR